LKSQQTFIPGFPRIKLKTLVSRRLLVASESGRNVKLENILKHELAPVPLSLAKTDSTLHSTTKSDLIQSLTYYVKMFKQQKISRTATATCLLIDAPALTQVIGKPDNAKTFGDLAYVVCKSVNRKFTSGYS
jgi:hypothetical protein